MWWSDRRSPGNRFAHLAVALSLAACAGGCFQPLYADRSPDGGPGLRAALGTVDVKQISATKGSDEARLAVELRNALMFDLTGGGAPAARPAYSLTIRISSTVADIIVDTTTTRPAIEDYG